MVSVELAVAIPAAVVVLALALAALGLVVDQIRCVDAARAGARAASRGDDPAAVDRSIRMLAPSGATVTISGSDLVAVEVRADHGSWKEWLPDAVTPGAVARAQREGGTP